MEELRAYDYAGMREQDGRERLTKAVRVAVKDAVKEKISNSKKIKRIRY